MTDGTTDNKAMTSETVDIFNVENIIVAIESNLNAFVLDALENGFYPDSASSGGVPMLYIACKNRNYASAKHLLEHGANPNCHDLFGETPLHSAICNRDRQLIELLLSYGADVNAKNNIGDTPLLKLTYLHGSPGDFDIADTLLNHGANINERYENGDTPLHYACQKNGRDEHAKYLISHGADLTAKNKKGESALYVACKYLAVHRWSDTKIPEILAEAGAIDDSISIAFPRIYEKIKPIAERSRLAKNLKQKNDGDNALGI